MESSAALLGDADDNTPTLPPCPVTLMENPEAPRMKVLFKKISYKCA